MDQSYPKSGQPPEPERRPPPQPIVRAVRLMYAGAALSAISLVIALVAIGSLKSSIEAQYPHYTPAHVHSVEMSNIAGEVFRGVIATGLWLWMAYAIGRGRSWARIVSSVLFAINTLNLIASIILVHAADGVILEAVGWLVGLGAIVLIWSRDSGPFFEQEQLA